MNKYRITWEYTFFGSNIILANSKEHALQLLEDMSDRVLLPEAADSDFTTIDVEKLDE